MKLIVVAFALVAVAVAAPPAEEAKILRSGFNQSPNGGYQYGYETDTGILRTETSVVKEAVDEENKPHNVVTVLGSSTYTNPEGKSETINYFAYETGFHAEGDSIPKFAAGR